MSTSRKAVSFCIAQFGLSQRCVELLVYLALWCVIVFMHPALKMGVLLLAGCTLFFFHAFIKSLVLHTEQQAVCNRVRLLWRMIFILQCL